MPVFKIYQKVTYDDLLAKEPKRHALEKHSEIIGYDLAHAIDGLSHMPEPIRKELKKKYWSRFTDERGRTIYIEITDQRKA